eukprot:CAMPEP_0203830324 /NCGR_PEP_ID=MMETSP0115-20131106/65733_1 /ASSEMBLY_ACC=CAM_ASM_000227 /TAXON_ID=33651 /ORGANISM="Bicosoecid sp, Strain ms1" /LENGTH=123 /DNA_ID=CAMNT_0050739387 /DNA_START=170 /DNA_END=537 /DNA_ORIENTATION=+
MAGSTAVPHASIAAVLDAASSGAYAVLCVAPGASDVDVRKAYRKLALRFHPDKNGDADAGKAFVCISEAFDKVGRPDARAAYDRAEQEAAAAKAARGGEAAGAGATGVGFRWKPAARAAAQGG